MKEKIQDLWFKLRGYWRTPPKGYEVSYKEATNLVLANTGNSLHGVFGTWAGLSVSVPLMVSYFRVSTGVLFLLGLIGTLLVFVKRPILSWVIDNSRSVNGKFRRLLVLPTVISSLMLTLVPFIPQVWVETNLFSLTIPAIPVMGITEDSDIVVSLGILVAYLLTDGAAFVYEFATQGLAGLQNTITTVSQERSVIASVISLVGPWPATIMSVAIPFMAAWFFSGGTGNVLIYRIVFPICALGNIGFMLFAYFGTHERIVAGKSFKAKVGFLTGAKALCRNKYFWLVLIYDIFKGISGGANFALWVCYYAIGGATGDSVLAVCNMILGTGCALGIFGGPPLAKKFGKVKVFNLSNMVFAVVLGLQLLLCKVPYALLVFFFLQNTINSFSYFSDIMKSEALDYEQYRSGLRLDGFWANFSGLISTVIGVFTGMLSPIFMSMAGVGFGDPIDVSFTDRDIMYSAFFYTTLLAFLASVIKIIPMFFFDLNEQKHADIVRALRIRASCLNYASGDLTDDDIINTKEILDYCQNPENTKKQTAFIRDELVKHTEYDAIVARYDEAKRRKEEDEQATKQENFMRECEGEEKRCQYLIGKEKERAQRKNLPFFEDAFRAAFVEKSRFLCDLTSEEQAALTEEVSRKADADKNGGQDDSHKN